MTNPDEARSMGVDIDPLRSAEEKAREALRMTKSSIDFGDRLISVQMPATPVGFDRWSIENYPIREITVGRLAGPMGWYLTAQITFHDDRPDIIVPLHMAERIEVNYGD